jgi:hypothetical protein
LTDLKAKIASELQDAKTIASQDAKIREEMAALDQHLAGVQSKLLILRQREGKLWLIPDKGSTTKEPILATVSASGVKLERFDRPDQTKSFSTSSARSEFDSYLDGVKPLDQYIVFLVRPSGIGLFEGLVKSARAKNIEVGFDALEENKDIYYSTPPVIDETVPVLPGATAYAPGSGGYSDSRGGAGNTTGANGGQRGAPEGANGSGAGANNRGGNQSQSTPGPSGNGTRTGTNSGGRAANSGHAATTNAGSGSEPDSSAAKAAEVKKASATASSKPTTPPKPVVKSWWQRFLEWIGYKS